MQRVYIKTSQTVLLKRYAMIFLLFSPFILMYIFAKSERYLVLFLMLAYYIPLFLIFVFEIFSNYNKIVVEMNEEGIKIFNRNFYRWDEIYVFKIVEKKVKTQTLRRGTEVTKKYYLQINESKYTFDNQYLKFTTEQIAEVIQIYKQKMDDKMNRYENLPMF